jgi:hypothetical protein
MKNYWKTACFLCLLSLFSLALSAQNLQLHYDLRHTVDPAVNLHNYPTLYFEYFKPARDSGQAFIKPGSFLLKTEADLLGSGDNMGKFYLQVSQSFRCWKPGRGCYTISGSFQATSPAGRRTKTMAMKLPKG